MTTTRGMKPRIRACPPGAFWWECRSDTCTGWGMSPAEAYERWLARKLKQVRG